MDRETKRRRLVASIKAGEPPKAEQIPSDFGYQTARARRELAQAALAERRVIEVAGSLMDRAEVLATLGEAERIFRECMATRRAELVATLANCSDEAELTAILQDYDNDRLVAIADSLERM